MKIAENIKKKIYNFTRSKLNYFFFISISLIFLRLFAYPVSFKKFIIF